MNFDTFREEELRKLLLLLRLGKWVLGEESGRYEILKNFYESVLVEARKSLAGKSAASGLNGVGISPDLEEEAYSILEEYEEYVFWEELPHRLAGRDLDREDRTGDEERFEELVATYKSDFEKRGVQGLVLSEIIDKNE